MGKPDLTKQPFINNPQATKAKIVKSLNDLYVQDWTAKLGVSSKGRNYSIFKESICLETYLTTLPRNAYIPMVKFGTANFKLPIETGRLENVSLDERKCYLCDKNDTGDDFHYLLICPFSLNKRKDLIKQFYYTRLIPLYNDLLACKNKKGLINLSKMMKIIMNNFS